MPKRHLHGFRAWRNVPPGTRIYVEAAWRWYGDGMEMDIHASFALTTIQTSQILRTIRLYAWGGNGEWSGCHPVCVGAAYFSFSFMPNVVDDHRCRLVKGSWMHWTISEDPPRAFPGFLCLMTAGRRATCGATASMDSAFPARRCSMRSCCARATVGR